MGNSIKAYMNDIMVNQVCLHTTDLRKAIEYMMKHIVRLNPTNSAARVKSDKFMGFMVSDQ